MYLNLGDYVNGQRISCFKNENCEYDIWTIYNEEDGYYYGWNIGGIEDVVTKEQFDSIKYHIYNIKVGD